MVAIIFSSTVSNVVIISFIKINTYLNSSFTTQYSATFLRTLYLSLYFYQNSKIPNKNLIIHSFSYLLQKLSKHLVHLLKIDLVYKACFSFSNQS